MATGIVLPALSAGMETGTIARWLKAEGDAVAAGEALAEVETDKATLEIEAPSAGRLGRIVVPAGQSVPVGQTIAVLLAEGEAAPAGAVPPPRPAAGSPPAAVAAAAPAPAAAVPAGAAPRHRASPLARRLAAQAGLDLAGLSGAGPRGRIVRIDIERARAAAAAAVPAAETVPAAAPPVAAAPVSAPPVSAPSGRLPPLSGAYETLPHSSMRRTIARRLSEAKATIPHFYLDAEADMEALLVLRTRCNEGRASGERLSINDFVLKAAAVALRRVPDMRVIWTADALLRSATVDICVAVAVDGGLVTPVVRDADTKSLGALSAEVKALSQKARDGRLKPADYEGGCFSLSNLGMYGVPSFTAIINPPQSGILAVGAVVRRPVVRGEAIVPAPVMHCTLSVDHRAVDGAAGAAWLAAFREGLENPLGLLV